MKLNHSQLQAVALLGAVVCLGTALDAQETGPAVAEPTATPEDVIIVREKEIEDLRLRVERAEDDVFARFNEINSDDSYDIHCYERGPIDSRIARRVCLSNAARAADTAIADATVRAMQGSGVGTSTGVAQARRATQRDTEQRVHDELGRLAQDDPTLRARVERLGNAYRALNVAVGSPTGETPSAEPEPGTAPLPAAAEHRFDVRVGDGAWNHALTSRAFTLATVQGADPRLARRLRQDRENPRLQGRRGVDHPRLVGLVHAASHCGLGHHVRALRARVMPAVEQPRPPFPPFTSETAAQKVRMAEDAWNTRDSERVSLAYTADSVWRNRSEFLAGREAIKQFLVRKWARELDYRLVKELWASHGNRIAVRFAYEWHDDGGKWYRSYGNENWEFDDRGFMQRRIASINDLPIAASERKFHWPLGRRPDDHPGLSALGL
jgi:uncharacterized protein